MRTPIPLTLAAFGLLALSACSGNTIADSGEDEEESCDCVEAEDYLPVAGFWTIDTGQYYYDQEFDCTGEGFVDGIDEWLNGSMEIKGRVPHDLYVFLNNEEDQYYSGKINEVGGIVFAGIREQNGQTVQFSIGGLAYDDAYLGRMAIKGFAYAAVDSIGDGELDCGTRADFIAYKSGR